MYLTDSKPWGGDIIETGVKIEMLSRCCQCTIPVALRQNHRAERSGGSAAAWLDFQLEGG
jgi:hypothetical protein